jgi:hypothetical protein
VAPMEVWVFNSSDFILCCFILFYFLAGIIAVYRCLRLLTLISVSDVLGLVLFRPFFVFIFW